MSDREYVKVNTSIRTGSNAEHLITDDDGNIQATIELRLPDDLFKRSTGTKLVNDVRMQTGKFRLSLENTPIAAIPVDETLSHQLQTEVSTCALDVYPFSVLDDTTLKPNPFVPGSPFLGTAFPNYKSHTITYTINIYSNPNSTPSFTKTAVKQILNGSTDVIPDTSDDILDFLNKCDIFSKTIHYFNLFVKNNHERLQKENQQYLLRNIGTLEQMLADAIENAVTYASTAYNLNIIIDTLPTNPKPEGFDDLVPTPQEDIAGVIHTETTNVAVCLWKINTSLTNTDLGLSTAFKPKVTLGGDTLTISYDTAPFSSKVPILWTTPFVDTYDSPEQLTLDQLRKSLWIQPPPKRQYQYGVNESETHSYDITLNKEITCAVMNIVANEEMKNTFSFLPWIPFPLTTYQAFLHQRRQITLITQTEYQRLYVVKATYNSQDGTYTPTTERNLKMRQSNGPVGRYTYSFTVNPNDDPMDESKRFSQITATNGPYGWGNTTTYTNLPPYSIRGYITRTISEDDAIISSEVYSKQSSTGTTHVSHNVTTEPIPASTENYLQVTGAMMFHNPLTDNEGVFNFGYHPGGNWGTTAPVNQWIPAWDPAVIEKRTNPNGTITYTWTWWGTEKNGDVFAMRYCNGIGGTDYTYIVVQYGGDTYTNTKTTTVDEYDEVTKLDTEQNTDIVPNMPVKNFYILDGTTATLSIDSPEPVEKQPIPTFTLVKTGEQHSEKINSTTTTTFSSYITQDYYFRGTSTTQMGETLQAWDANQRWPNLDEEPGYNDTVRKYVYLRYEIILDSQMGETGKFKQIFYMPNTKQGITLDFNWNGERTNLTVHHEQTYPTGEEVTHPAVTMTGSDDGQMIGSPNPLYINETYHTPLETGTTVISEIVQDEITEVGKSSHPTPVTVDISRDATMYLRTDKNSAIDWTQDNPSDQMHAYQGGMTLLPSLTVADFTTYDIPPILRFAPMISETYAALDDMVVVRYPNAGGEGVDRYCNLYTMFFDVGNCSFPKSLTKTKDVTKRWDVRTISEYTSRTITDETDATSTLVGNVRLSFTWPNLPMVVLSPIQSIVLTLQGMRVNQEFQPINITEKDGSSLTATFPIVENFYSLASTLRDLHDELVVVKDDFDSTATYSLDAQAGQERVLRLSAYYITKDGTLHQIYIPPNGVFSLQLIFGLSFYYTS